MWNNSKVTFVDVKANIAALFLNTLILHIIWGTHVFFALTFLRLSFILKAVVFYFFPS